MKIEKEKFVALSEKDQNLQLLRVSICKKWPLYCPQGSGTLRQQL